jgi:hypothetical protein
MERTHTFEPQQRIKEKQMQALNRTASHLAVSTRQMFCTNTPIFSTPLDSKKIPGLPHLSCLSAQNPKVPFEPAES